MAIDTDADAALADVSPEVGELMASHPVLRNLVERRSRRKWLQRPVPDEMVLAILESGRWAPSAGNFQPWHFVVATDVESRARITRVADEYKNLSRIWAPYFREGARRGYLIDFTEVPLCIAIFSDPRHAPPHVDGNLHHIVGASLALQNMWLAAGMAIQNLWLAARARGLGACLWTHLEQDQMKSILGVPHHYYFAGLVGLGYPADEPADEADRRRKPLAETVGHEWFKVRPGEAPPPEKLALLEEFLPR